MYMFVLSHQRRIFFGLNKASYKMKFYLCIVKLYMRNGAVPKYSCWIQYGGLSFIKVCCRGNLKSGQGGRSHVSR